MSETKYPYRPHGFLAGVGIDFEGLDVLTGTEIYSRIADWIYAKGSAGIVPPWLVESTALLYHIVFGCAEKRKTITGGRELKAWEKLQKSHTDMAYRSWRQIWQMSAGYRAADCGRSAADEVCALFGKYNRQVLVGGNHRKKRKPKFDFELSDLPDWEEE